MGFVYIDVAVVAVCGVIRWWLYLRLCRHVFDRTGDPQSLRHVAVPTRAFHELHLKLPGRGG